VPEPIDDPDNHELVAWLRAEAARRGTDARYGRRLALAATVIANLIDEVVRLTYLRDESFDQLYRWDAAARCVINSCQPPGDAPYLMDDIAGMVGTLRGEVDAARSEADRLRHANRRLRARLGLFECLADAAVGVFGRETTEPADGDAPRNVQEAHHGPQASGTEIRPTLPVDAMAPHRRSPGEEPAR